jgi:geranylgeranyl diphosphate synthase type II
MVKEYLNALEAEIEHQDLGIHPIELYEPIQYLMALGGKRIRPVLCLLAYSLFEEHWQQALPPSLSLEIFHNFTLMHDDIMDKAPLRRGKQTVHEKWNDNIAILSGDVMLVNAYQYLNKIKGLNLSEFQYALMRFNKTAAEVCEGQQMDMNFETRLEVSLEEYIEMIRLKTSVLIGLSMELGAILAQQNNQMSNQLYKIGELIGLGFQLKDDLLDVYGDPEKFGKQIGGDILANKKTYLLIRALTLAQGGLKNELLKWLSMDNSIPEQKIRAITSMYTSLGVKQETELEIKKYFDEAFMLISKLNIVDEKKLSLLKFMGGLVDREV